jgi:ATP-dependent DNA helicase RecQ
MSQLQEILEERFGLSGFRPGQRSVIEAVLEGRDVLAQWPTGAGKSLAFQLPAMLAPHPTLVVSPLVALMHDQVQRMRQMGLEGAASISAHSPPQQNLQTLRDLQQGRARLVYVAPERFSAPGFLQALQGLSFSLLAVDEAHCITQWGHDFRPDYLRLGQAVTALRPRSVLALTASATPAIRQQIARRLEMRQPQVFVLPLDRPNLHLEALEVHHQTRRQVLLSHLGRRGALPAVIYTSRRQDAQEVAAFLLASGILSECYHAGLSADRRRLAQERFLAGEVAVMVATVAFGMGIDKADVRSVVHLAPPPSLEAYYQEAGRAGRDGDPARCLLLYSKADFALRRTFARRRYPDREVLDAMSAALPKTPPTELRARFRHLSPECWRMSLTALLGHGWNAGQVPAKRNTPRSAWMYLEGLRRAEVERLDGMEHFARTPGCRRRVLLSWFGESPAPACGNCDHCRRPGKPGDSPA